MSLARFVMLVVPFVMLPIWAGETVAIRRPERRRLGWRLAIASIVAALGLAAMVRWVMPPSLMVFSVATAAGLTLFACDVALIVWGYVARASSARGFPVHLVRDAHHTDRSNNTGDRTGQP